MDFDGDNFVQKVVENSEKYDCENSSLCTNKENKSGTVNHSCDLIFSGKVNNTTKEASEQPIYSNVSPNKEESMKKIRSLACTIRGEADVELKNESEETTFLDSPNKKCKIGPKNDFLDTTVNSKYFKDSYEDVQNSIKISDSDKPLNNKKSATLDVIEEGMSNQNMHFDEMNSYHISHPNNVSELTEICSKSSREKSCFITSQVPDICMKQPCVLGIDEAGRGPVLGPMVYGVCYCPKSKEDDLKETGCADSKTLTEEKREKIFNEICKHCEYIGWEVEVISPNVISTSMLRRSKVSLNEVSHNSAIGLIKRTLEAGVMVSEVFVDTVGPAEKYEAKLKNLFPELLITVAKKADATYPIVGGASICAKVTRDVAIKSWTFSETESLEEWGSGYPNDPVTKKFLTSTMDPIFGFPNIVRFSWSTAEKILEDCAVQVDWENEEDLAKNTASVKSFFSTTEQKQHKYFKDRCLKNTVTL